MSTRRAFASSDGFRFRGKGISGTITAGTTGNIDYKITEAKYINGINIILKNHKFDDCINFQIVDVDNILGNGAGVVLDTFGETWFVAEDIQNQSIIKIEYPASIVKDLYIRIKYTSTGTTNVEVKANLFLHKAP